MEAPANSLMKISAWTDDEVMNVSLDDKQVDAINFDGTVYYKLNLENDKIYDFDTIKKSNLVFELDPYSGSL